MTFLTATPLGVVNLGRTGKNSSKALKELKEVIDKEIRKGHLDIYHLQEYLRSTKLTKSLKFKMMIINPILKNKDGMYLIII